MNVWEEIEETTEQQLEGMRVSEITRAQRGFQLAQMQSYAQGEAARQQAQAEQSHRDNFDYLRRSIEDLRPGIPQPGTLLNQEELRGLSVNINDNGLITRAIEQLRQSDRPGETPSENGPQDTLQEPNEERTRSRRRQFMFPVQQGITEEGIAIQLVEESKWKMNNIAKMHTKFQKQIITEDRKIEEKKRLIQSAIPRLSFYSATAELVKQSESQIIAQFTQTLKDLEALEQIEKVEMDTRKRLLITTKQLYTKKEDWSRKRRIGIYQMRFDFSQNSIEEGIQILNTTKSNSDTYDSPTINFTKPCWGNIKADIERDFFTVNLQELVSDLLLYITSPNDQSGYLTGWEEFLEEAVRRPANYTFAQFDRDNHSETHERPTENEMPILEPDLLATSDEQQVERLNALIRTRNQELQNGQRRQRELASQLQNNTLQHRNQNDVGIHYALKELGILDEDILLFYYKQITKVQQPVTIIDLEQQSSHLFDLIIHFENHSEEDTEIRHFYLSKAFFDQERLNHLFEQIPKPQITIHGDCLYIDSRLELNQLGANDLTELQHISTRRRVSIPVEFYDNGPMSERYFGASNFDQSIFRQYNHSIDQDFPMTQYTGGSTTSVASFNAQSTLQGGSSSSRNI